MGSGLSSLLVPSCLKTASQNEQPDVVFSGPLDETLGHSFCYIRSPSNSARFLSPSSSLRLPETAPFKTISGASVGANTSAPRSVLQPDLIYHNATETDQLNSTGFESSASFSAVPLRLDATASSGPLDRPSGATGFFMSGPIERSALSGPLDAQLHFSGPLGGAYPRTSRRRKKSFSGNGVRGALSRSFSEKKRPWVVPVLNFVGRRDPAAPNSDHSLHGESSKNVHWAHGKAGEDRVHVVVSEDQDWLFVGIYDGFNGPDAPEFLMGHLYRAIFDELEGLFWEKVEAEEDGRDGALENDIVVAEGADLPLEITQGRQCGEEQSECVENSSLPSNFGSVKRVTFQSEHEMGSARLGRGKTLWEFLAEADDDDDIDSGLDLSGSDRFSFSVDNAFRVDIASSIVRRKSLLLSKLKYGFNRQRERNRKLFQWKNDWENKEKIEAHNRVEERLRRSFRRSKAGPIDHGLVLRALSRALEITEAGYLEMTDKFHDQNPELALMGSCLLVVLMKGEDVYVMNVGDSRAIVAQYQPQDIGSSSDVNQQSSDGNQAKGIVEESSEAGARAQQLLIDEADQIMKLTALQLSTDHSTSIKEEVLRIKEEHPDDSQCIVNDRVKGRLKVTRAFGAGFLKQPKWNNSLLEMFRNEYIGTEPYITCSPSLCHHKLGPNDQFLVLSSDGLYQYLSNQEVVLYVEGFMEKSPDGDPAQHLIEELLSRAAKKAGMDFHELLDIPQGDRRKYHDDVTVMVISLEGRIWKSSGKYL